MQHRHWNGHPANSIPSKKHNEAEDRGFLRKRVSHDDDGCDRDKNSLHHRANNYNQPTLSNAIPLGSSDEDDCDSFIRSPSPTSRHCPKQTKSNSSKHISNGLFAWVVSTKRFLANTMLRTSNHYITRNNNNNNNNNNNKRMKRPDSPNNAKAFFIRSATRHKKQRLLLALAVVVLMLYTTMTGLSGLVQRLWVHSTTATLAQRIRSTVQMRRPVEDIPLLFDHLLASPKQFHRVKFRYPNKQEKIDDEDSSSSDFGGLEFKLLDDGASRQIYHDLKERKPYDPDDGFDYSDYVDKYFAFDDDTLRNSMYDFYDDETEVKKKRCRRSAWYRYSFPTCQTFHELDLSDNVPRLVGDGQFRQVFLLERALPGSITEKVVFKELLMSRDMNYIDRETIRMDALVSERLTSKKNLVDIYGFCALSMLSETFEHGDIENDVIGYSHHRSGMHSPIMRTHNSFTPSQKLKLALSMAEPLSHLHNYEGGIIVHDDLDLGQYLWTDETKTSVKLNDFNRAEFMLYDEENQEFCEYKNGKGGGYWRAPEEFNNDGLSNKIDIYSLGNNFYSLLTGMYPYFNHDDADDFQRSVRIGRTPPIDPGFYTSSYAEGKMADVIKRCYVFEPENRADIDEVITMLKEAIEEDEMQQKAK